MSALALLAGSVAGAQSTPSPGTAVQIARLVATSQGLKTLPSHLVPSLARAADDDPQRIWPQTKGGCNPTPLCVFGDTTSSDTLVLWGDSHAEMWLSAIKPFALQHHVRIVLLTSLACPVADLTVWVQQVNAYLTSCDTKRQTDIQYINQLKPRLLVLSERTSGIMSSPTTYFTNSQWQSGFQSTLAALKPSGARTVVIGDIQAQDRDVPSCLASFPTALQDCSVPNPNLKAGREGHASAESAAAASEHDWFIDPTKWLCAKRCAPIIGRIVVYWDAFHITNTYSAFLSRVLGAKLYPIWSATT